VLIFCAAFLALSLATYDPADPSLNNAVGKGANIANAAGLVGAYVAGFLADFFGIGAWFFPVAVAVAGLSWLFPGLRPRWWRWFGLFLLAVCVTGGAASARAEAITLGDLGGGGFLGRLLHGWALYYLRSTGALLVWVFATLVSLQLVIGVTWTGALKRISDRIASGGEKRAERRARKKSDKQRRKQDKLREKERKQKEREQKRQAGRRAQPAKAGPVAGSPKAEDELDIFGKFSAKNNKKPAKKAEPAKKSSAKTAGDPAPPDTDLLDPVKTGPEPVSRQVLERQSESLSECLADFGIQGEVAAVEPGPVVTMFEYRPAPGVKISRIANLSDDLALALKAKSIRIEAPLPGRDTVGVEIPNPDRQTVYLREILESSEFADSDSLLTMALGKDIYGRPAVADLSRMPHLLVAGATGMGKSVCLNSILISFMYKASPEQVKLLLVDPKRIELAVYSEVPHLVHPVVTEANLAKNALDWAVHEMERRYEAMAALGVRNIDGYNRKLAGFGEEPPEEFAEFETMPLMVIIIDELADLMLTARKEVETSIVRLAQLARAAGIHMIIATQRPSVDVVTGLIKANFPSRIAFTVTSPQDSRTILDTVGANHLLGKGDMLFKPGGGKNRRLHGAWITEDEIGRVIDYWKRQQPPKFEVDLEEWAAESSRQGGGPGGEAGDLADDPEYREAVNFVIEQGKASISLIQRRFRIGFNKAARYVEQMEADGIIGPQEGSKPRQVLRPE
jgi:S-DNA-T family DNA segregation ATPase FtsK/SpoIIIE